MLVADIMTAQAVTTRPDASAKDALRELSERSITALPVVDGLGRLVGIVSEADLLLDGVVSDPRSLLRRPVVRTPVRGLPATVEEIMTRHVLTASPGEDVAAVVGAMLDSGVHSVPVVQGSRVVGVLSRSDVVRALARADTHIAAEVEALLVDAGLSGWRCEVEDGEARLGGGPADQTRLAANLARAVTGVRCVVVARPAGLA